MITLHIRTDNPQALVALYDNQKCLINHQWEAHRQLAESFYVKAEMILKSVSMQWEDVEGIVVYEGPGSFTGLRIGIAAANGLAAGLDVPIVAKGGDEWQQEGISSLLKGDSDAVALPQYGGDPHITLPKK